MLYREIIAACSEIYTKHINTLGGPRHPQDTQIGSNSSTIAADNKTV
jgi:hypothetical protein